jgi:transcriptional regulator with GAF, ATPase, and Fis domain
MLLRAVGATYRGMRQRPRRATLNGRDAGGRVSALRNGHVMTDGSGRDDAAAELAALLLSTGSFDELLRGVAELAVRIVDGAATASITLAERNRVITVAAADAVATQIDQHQYDHNAGPCLDALGTATVVHVADLRRDGRWGELGTVMSNHGVAGVLAVPVMARDGAVGVLNLYGGGFDERDQEMARTLAAHAAVALTAALRTYDQVSLTDNLRIALSSRSVIDQAIGIVMGRERCSADKAFDVLRKVSQQRNTKLRQVATELVTAIARASGDVG